jgi:hypothetical protein
MVAAQNLLQTAQGNKVETMIHHTKQTQVSVRLIESLSEEMDVKLSSLSVFCSLFQLLAAAN